MMSFNATGIPCSGPRVAPRASSASACFAAPITSSASRLAKLWSSPSRASARRRSASLSSTGERRPRRIASAAATRVVGIASLILALSRCPSRRSRPAQPVPALGDSTHSSGARASVTMGPGGSTWPLCEVTSTRTVCSSTPSSTRTARSTTCPFASRRSCATSARRSAASTARIRWRWSPGAGPSGWRRSRVSTPPESAASSSAMAGSAIAGARSSRPARFLLRRPCSRPDVWRTVHKPPSHPSRWTKRWTPSDANPPISSSPRTSKPRRA